MAAARGYGGDAGVGRRAQVSETGETPTRRARPGRWIGGSLGVLALVSAGVWLARREIAAHFVDAELARRGVPVRYRIAELGFNETRLTNVVIGDPRAPDLVADWVVIGTRLSLSGAELRAVRAGTVRLRARLADGKLSFGAIDRLLPTTGQAFALPAIDADIADGRARVETPWGLIHARLSGRGRLDDGFAGRLALASDRAAASGCAATRLAAPLVVGTHGRTLSLSGPVRAAALECGQAVVSGLALEVEATLGAALDRWQGQARLSAAALRTPSVRLGATGGTVSFAGDAAATRGALTLAGAGAQAPGVSAARLAVRGDYGVGRDGLRFVGDVSADHAALDRAWRATIARTGEGARGTPAAPLAQRAAAAAQAAASDFAATTRIEAQASGADYAITLTDARLTSASGAAARLVGAGLTVDRRGVAGDGRLEIAGDGLPSATLALHRADPQAPLSGRGVIAPYAAGAARLSLTDIDFALRPESGWLSAQAVLSGPLPDGRIEAAHAPIRAVWDARGLALNPGCTPVAFAALTSGSLALGPTSVSLCAADRALARIANGRVSGGARTGTLHLRGKLGDSALALSAGSARYDFAAGRFAATGIDSVLGSGESVSRLHLDTIDGAITGHDVAGKFAGAAGRIGTVPLDLSQGAGNWRFADERLTLGGLLRVADTAPEPRFLPLVSRDVALTLADSRITGTASLANPATGTLVTRVALAHDLRDASGHAELTVPGIAFNESFQPDRLTPLTYGLIADVRGMLTGEGLIDWTADKVTSTGRFATTRADFSAAVGPVERLSTEIRFTDLLNFESAPGQEVRIGLINPGVPVADGVIRYQLLADQHVRIEGGRWPFAGGTLSLEPALLDLSVSTERRLTFRLDGVDAGQFLQQLDYKNLDATGTFDGTLPIVFDARGGRVEGGKLSVRERGGTIAYVGEISQRDLGFWGNTAFQALKSLKYRQLDIILNGALDGEVITELRFAGLAQGKGAKSNFVVRRLQQLPFVFNVKITAPFRQLLDSAASLYDPKRLITRNLSALIDAQNAAIKEKSVQDGVSQPMPKGDPK